MGFAFEDAPAFAKVFADFARSNDVFKIKGGFLGKQTITADGVKALADLPPLPMVRAQLIGTIQAPASKLARLLKEPGRQIAAVLQARASNEA
jgi:large subunit ribosomal protein L10